MPWQRENVVRLHLTSCAVVANSSKLAASSRERAITSLRPWYQRDNASVPEMPYMFITHVKDKMSNSGISHFAHFFLPRSLRALATMWRIANEEKNPRIRQSLLFMVEQCNWECRCSLATFQRTFHR